MLFSHLQFEEILHDHLSFTTRGEQLENTVSGMMRELDNVMGLERGSLINTQHLSTLFTYYEDRSKRMANYGDKDQMWESKYRARTIAKIAEKHGSSEFTLRANANKAIINQLLDSIPTEMRTTDYERMNTPYMFTTEPHAAEEDPLHTPEPLIRKAEPQKAEPRKAIQPREKPQKPEKVVKHRPVEAIRADYKHAWQEVADANTAKGIRYLATLTNNDSPAPWLNTKPDNFAGNMQATREAARTHGVHAQRLLTRIDGLYDEFHAAREQAQGHGR